MTPPAAVEAAEKEKNMESETLSPQGQPHEESGGDKCEGCGEPAVTYDPEGVPLCAECAKA